MKLSKRVRISLLIALCVVVLGCLVLYAQTLQTKPEKDQLTVKFVAELLKTFHYSGQDINDAFSKKTFDGFLKRLDPNKRFFTKEDIDALKIYSTSIDDQIKKGEFTFFDEVFRIFDLRVQETETFYKDILSKPISLQSKDVFEWDPEKRDYPQTPKELRQYWEKLLKSQVILTYLQLIESRPTISQSISTSNPNVPYISELEQKARQKVEKELGLMFKNLKQEKPKDRMAMYMNAMANSFDPHTDYLPVEEKENFDISMTGRLEGIGAELREDEGFVKVSRVMPGSAAWRQKELKEDDLILKVAQGDGEPVDIVGMRVNDAVKLIRGKKGTEVRLTVKKPTGQIVVISIIRDVVILEDTYAKSALISIKGSKDQWGYIYLPIFYRNFNSREGRNSSDDLLAEINKLKQKGVKGIIIDLRNNTGGALEDALKMSGFFIPTGPVLQTRARGAEAPPPFYDQDPSVAYSGPLVVMINEYSASASEILAAALQDYGRAVIVGSPHSFGKGTVQTIINMDDYAQAYPSLRPMGSLKITVQKFYRITGESTQFKGVSSDVILPGSLDSANSGERSLPNALPWDTMAAQPFSKWFQPLHMDILKKRSEERVKQSMAFKRISEAVADFKLQKAKKTSILDINELFKEQKRNQFLAKQMKATANQMIEVNGLEAVSSSDVRAKEWIKQLSKDVYIEESTFILKDLASFGSPLLTVQPHK